MPDFAAGIVVDRTETVVHGVSFLIEDSELTAALRAFLPQRDDLFEVQDGDSADVVITDRLRAADLVWPGRTLLVGPAAGRAQGNALSSNDPRLILSAASLLAAGYRITAVDAARRLSAASTDLPHLSLRERQVAELLVEGASNKLIARRLDISVHTAKFHVAAVLEKLGARNRSDAVAIALRDGFVTL